MPKSIEVASTVPVVSLSFRTQALQVRRTLSRTNSYIQSHFPTGKVKTKWERER